MHVENEGGSAVVVDQTRQDHARQEGLARASGAKDTGRALDEFVQIKTDRVTLFAGIANAEDVLVIFFAKNGGDIGAISKFYGSVMAGIVLTVIGALSSGFSSRQAAYSGESTSGPVSIIRTGMTARLV